MQKSEFERKGQWAFWFLALTTVVLGCVTSWTVVRFRAEANGVEHTHHVLASLAAVKSAVTQAESNVRGYLVSGNEDLLEEFATARAQASEDVNFLAALVSENPGQQRRVRELGTAVTQRLENLTAISSARKAGATVAEITSQHGAEGRRLIATISGLTDTIRNEEQRLLNQLTDDRRNTETLVLALSAMGVLVSISLVGVGQRAIQNYRALRDGAQRDLERLNAELEHRVAERTATIQQANTELERSRMELSAIASALQRSNVELESFAYAASHDLQEPLRTITTFAQLMQRRVGADPAGEATMYLQTIIAASTRLQELIAGLLEYSRVSRDEVDSIETVPLNQVVAVVDKNLSAQIRESGAEISHDALPELRGNRIELIRLMQNLVGNSIKYRSPHRTCKVHITAMREGERWQVSIEDNGIGFKPEYSQQIFGIFKRLDRGYPGAGVGLAICKTIVERRGGSIWAEGEPGQGATFHFTWPAADAVDSGVRSEDSGVTPNAARAQGSNSEYLRPSQMNM